ncbi:MAG: methyltransferase domain-containing protein [Chitinophagaceae bacterium]|nr:methyltransferase domain-containing protein [Chitinophagaceae bacterium]
MIAAIKNLLGKTKLPTKGKPAVEAYDIWSDSYDDQPDNLMLELDELIFADLFGQIDVRNKKIADIGCGTGRHWQKLYDRKPSLVVGFDVSAGMLKQLNHKFPEAMTLRVTENLLPMVPDGFIDCLITTLTIAHIQDIDKAIAEWSRILVKGGNLIITDFHPSTLAKGGKRSFTHEGKLLSVTNFVHPLEKVKRIFNKNELYVVQEREKHVDEGVKKWYEMKNALSIYNRFKGMPIIYGLHLKKQHAAE